MRTVLLTLAALLAFAANSVLTRAALDSGAFGAGGFTAVRLISGALMLALLVTLRRGDVRAGSWPSAISLWVYAVAFSFAYIALDAGIGALILFPSVQVTMFAGSLWAGERPHAGRWLGAALGLAGLAVLFAPGATAPPFGYAALMVLAGAGFGVYSLRGRTSRDPIATTAGNFLRAAPLGLIVWILSQGGGTLPGYALAIASGALASGLGYAIWYTALPRIESNLAAIAQTSVPILAMLGGVLFLGEVVGPDFFLAAGLVLAGVLVAIYWPGGTKGSRPS